MVQPATRGLGVVLGALLATLADDSAARAAAPPAGLPMAPAAPATASASSPSLGTPVFASIIGDGKVVNFAWWAVKGATAGYEVLRTTNPQAPTTTIATVPAGTLGATDVQPGATGMYYQLVAIGPGGTRAAGAWVLVNTPTVTSITASGSDVLLTWSTIQAAPAGYEIWRTADPHQAGIRVGSVASGITTFTDPKPASGPAYYQIAALGGGARAASSWVASSAAPAVSGAPPIATSPSAGPAAGTGLSACGCPGAQGPPGPMGPPGPAGPAGAAQVPKELLQQIAALQAQVDTLRAALAVDTTHTVTLTAGHDLVEQVGGSESATVALDRSARVARDDSLTVGGSSVTSVAKGWQLTGGQAVDLSSGTGITLQVKSARYALGSSEGSYYLPGNWSETVDRDRTATIGRSETLNVGLGAATSVGTDWNLTAARAVALKAGKQLSLSSGQSSLQINTDSSVAISGTKVSVSAAGDLELVSGGVVTINGTQWVAGSAGPAQGFGSNSHPASGGTGAPCTLGDVTLTAGAIGNGTPADGRLLPIVGNQGLFAVFGINFGGDGKANFALPDLRTVAPNGLTYLICTQGVFPH